MTKLLALFLLILSLNAYAGKIEDAQIEALMNQTISNMKDREPYYQRAYQILNNNRLLPWDAMMHWQADKLPCGPVYERNIFHFFWARAEINPQMLGGTCYMADVHCHVCCADYMHGVATYLPTNVVTDYFREDIAKLYAILGSPEDLFKDLPLSKQTKIPDYAETLFLDYLIARHSGIRMGAYRAPKNIKPFSEVIKWSYQEAEVFDVVGGSIAYKVSIPANFTKFAAVPLMKYLTFALNGETQEIKDQAKSAIMKEIIVGFNLHHVDADVAILEDVATNEQLADLVRDNDPFGQIAKMEELHMFPKSFDKFYEYLSGSKPWATAVRTNLDEVRQALAL